MRINDRVVLFVFLLAVAVLLGTEVRVAVSGWLSRSVVAIESK